VGQPSQPASEEQASGACPFCRRAIYVNWEDGVLVHALPMCPKFEPLTADEFVNAVLRGEHLS